MNGQCSSGNQASGIQMCRIPRKCGQPMQIPCHYCFNIDSPKASAPVGLANENPINFCQNQSPLENCSTPSSRDNQPTCFPGQNKNPQTPRRIGGPDKPCTQRPNTCVYLCRDTTKGEQSQLKRTTTTGKQNCNKGQSQAPATRRSNLSTAPAAVPINGSRTNSGQGNQAITICPAYFKPCYGFGDAEQLKKFFECPNQVSTGANTSKKPLPGRVNKSRARGRKGRSDRGSNDMQRGVGNFTLDEDNWVKICSYGSPTDSLLKGKGKKGAEVIVRPKWQK